VVVASSNKTKVDRAVAGLPGEVEGRVLDVTDEEQVRLFFQSRGAFDHLVFTAGEQLLLGELETASLEQAKQFFTTRLWGAWTAAKYGSGNILPGGSIVLSSGIAGARPQKGWTVAAALCGAVEALTHALAVELAPIRVNAVSAGVVRTELWQGMAEADRSAFYQTAGQALPTGRVGEAADIAKAHLYLMTEAFSTATVLTVDGGASVV